MLRFLVKPLRTISTSTKKSDQTSPQFSDFRPAWFYTFAGVASNISIFGIMTYSIFFYDFGNDEHVFQPIRRWVARQKCALFALSPDEEKFVESEKRKVETRGVSKSGS